MVSVPRSEGAVEVYAHAMECVQKVSRERLDDDISANESMVPCFALSTVGETS